MNKEEKIQRLYELRRVIFTKLNEMSIVPEKVENIMKTALTDLGKLYNAQGVSTDTIVSYIDGKFNETKANINTRSENDRRGVYWKQIENLLNKLEEKVLNDEELNESDINGFEIKDENRGSTVNYIVDMINESLNDVQNRQRRLMANRGFSDEQIKTKNDMVKEFIGMFMTNKADEITALYDNREKELMGEILEKVTEFINEMKSIEKGHEKSLIEDLRVEGLTYKQQSANAINFNQNLKTGGQGLPTDLLK